MHTNYPNKHRRWPMQRGLRARHLPEGKLLVLMAILLPSLLGVAGLVFDGGLLVNEQRSLQHATDAAATAAAFDLRLGKTFVEAELTATEMIQLDNGHTDATVTVNIPPQSGPFAGDDNHVEVIVTREINSQLSHIIDGVLSNSIRSRAVAGVKDVTTEAAIVVLDEDPLHLSLDALEDIAEDIDTTAVITSALTQLGLLDDVAAVPIVGSIAEGLLETSLESTLAEMIVELWDDVAADIPLTATPTLIAGLEIEGLGAVEVDGAVHVNNRWGGTDEQGNIVGITVPFPHAVACTPLLPLTRMTASDLRVSGGVDDPDNYGPFVPGEENPLQANRLPVPDPFISLPAPSLASDPSNVSATVYDPGDVVRVVLPSDLANEVLSDVLGALSPLLQPLFQPLVGDLLDQLTTTTLQPGVYNSITVLAPLGGATFEPGVYIIRGRNPSTNISLLIAGPVEAEGVLFYITDSPAYNVANGLPDDGDIASNSPPNSLTSTLPSAVILPLLSGGKLSGLNDPASPFDGMLLYQRRLDRRPIIFEAQQLLGSGDVSGTIYSKWGHFCFVAGNGTYDLRLVAGTMRFVTVTTTTIAPTWRLPPAQDVLLLE